MGSRFLIYALTCPRCGAVRYIGKSTSGLARPKSHFAPSHLKFHNHRTAWLRSLKDAGLRYGVTVLEELTSAEGIDAAEIRWIASGRAQGWALTNGTDGGDGLLGRKRSAETNAKSAASQRGKLAPYNIERNKSEKQRAATSAALKGRVYSAETLQRMREAARRRVATYPPSARARAVWSESAKARERNADGSWPKLKPLARVRINLLHL